MGLAAVVKRLLVSAGLSAALMAAAVFSMGLSTAPRLVSMAIEPLSLLLMPGLVVAILVAGSHDYSPVWVIGVAGMFYCAFFFWMLSRSARGKRLPGGASS